MRQAYMGQRGLHPAVNLAGALIDLMQDDTLHGVDAARVRAGGVKRLVQNGH